MRECECECVVCCSCRVFCVVCHVLYVVCFVCVVCPVLCCSVVVRCSALWSGCVVRTSCFARLVAHEPGFVRHGSFDPNFFQKSKFSLVSCWRFLNSQRIWLILRIRFWNSTGSSRKSTTFLLETIRLHQYATGKITTTATTPPVATASLARF